MKLFAFTHISNSLGTINPVAELCQKAHAIGALTLVDAAQSAGHMPVDVRELGCDFLAFSGHKMCGPTGIGVLYGRAEILDSMPPWHGGGEMIVSVTLERSMFKKAPHRFEAGTPSIGDAVGLAAAIDYIEQSVGQRFSNTIRSSLGMRLSVSLNCRGRAFLVQRKNAARWLGLSWTLRIHMI